MNAAARTYLWIGFGSMMGGFIRFACSQWVELARWPDFPWATLIVNVAGSLLIGFFAALSGPDGRLLISPDIRQFVTVGFCGGFTTFSAFSLQTLELIGEQRMADAALNAAASVVLCMAFVWVGHAGAAALNRMRSGE